MDRTGGGSDGYSFSCPLYGRLKKRIININRIYMKMKILFFLALILACVSCNNSRTKPEVVPQEVMQEIYEEIKTL